MMLTAKDIAGFPCEVGPISVTQVNQLCREGKLYGFKAQPGQFVPWIIPANSFATYLRYHPVYLNAFQAIDTSWMREEDAKVINVIKQLSKRQTFMESYTFGELSMIFDVPVNQIATWFGKPYLPIISKRHSVSAIQVANFLTMNPDRLKALQDRHGMLLANGDMMEANVRHILMLHAYYMANGKLV